MTNGAGYLALAAVIFGNWKIGRMLLACLFFGAATALQFHVQALGLPIPYQFPLMLPYVLTLLMLAGNAGVTNAPAALGAPVDGN